MGEKTRKTFVVDTVSLIKAVRERPIVWNYNHNDFNNKHLRERAWSDIAEHLFNEKFKRLHEGDQLMNISMLQKRWKNIKDTYTRYKKMLAEKVNNKPRPYIHAKKLQFLDYNKRDHREMSLEYIDDKDGEEATEEEDQTAELKIKTEENDSDMIEFETSKFTVEDTKSNSSNSEDYNAEGDFQRSKKDLIDNYIVKAPVFASTSVCNVADVPEKSVTKNTDADNDADKLFMMSMVPLFKKLSDEKKMTARIQLTQVLQRLLYPPNKSS